MQLGKKNTVSMKFSMEDKRRINSAAILVVNDTPQKEEIDETKTF